jgi:hypothetical protein
MFIVIQVEHSSSPCPHLYLIQKAPRTKKQTKENSTNWDEIDDSERNMSFISDNRNQ